MRMAGLFMARNRHGRFGRRCPFIGAKQKWRGSVATTVFDPEATSAVTNGNAFDAGFRPYPSTSEPLRCPFSGLGSEMQRREFVKLLSSAAAAWPSTVLGQQLNQVRRIGVLMEGVDTDPTYQSFFAAFVQGLRQFGWIEGPNLRIDVRWSASNTELARSYSAELIGLRPDVILAATTLNLTMIHQATSTVPVVFVAVADPVKQGFVSSMRQPGGNLTGFALFEFSLGSKWINLLKDILPDLARVAVMFNPDTGPQTKFFMSAIEAEAPALGAQVIPMPVRAVADIEPALASFAGQPNIGLILLPDIFLDLHASQIAELVGRYRLPAIATIAIWKHGVLMVYGNTVKLADQFRQSATYVDRILKGTKPSDLPIQGADSYGLVINLKTAKALGITVPHLLLANADEVIE
jgi:putative tryptophan/tyrosine transport system substrate-binding protein